MTDLSQTQPPAIRPAAAEEAAAVAEIYLASRHQLVPFAPLVHDDDDVRRWVRAFLLLTCTVTVAELGGVPVAFSATVENVEGSWIEQLYVHPDHVGCGLGTLLLHEALQRLPEPVRLYTFQPNTGARRFYERHGFVVASLGDGSGNEEGVPDVLYMFGRLETP
jgi:GNAT superfamily N-acetyltransferase